MERNEVSFSIPTWRKEEIKSIGLADEEALYMTSPYNLNDFKSGHQSLEYIFAPTEEPSDIRSFVAKRQLNPKVSQEVAIFTTFLYEVILQDNRLGSCERLPVTEKNLDSERTHNQLGVLKQKIIEMNLCKLKGVPKEFQAYYRNQIIKKIIFQYLGKCAYNISLIEILLISNDFLRFAVELCVKSVLFQGTLLSTFTDQVEYNEEVKMFVSYFGYLFVNKKEEDGSVRNLDARTRKLFAHEPNTLKTQHYLLKQTKDKRLFLYRKEIKQKYPIKTSPTKQIKILQPQKAKELNAIKMKTGNNLKEKIQQLKAQAKKQPRKNSDKGGFFSCLPCFNRN